MGNNREKMGITPMYKYWLMWNKDFLVKLVDNLGKKNAIKNKKELKYRENDNILEHA